MEYNLDRWMHAAAVPHESSVLYSGQNVFSEGIVLHLYQDGTIRAKRRYANAEEVKNETPAACVEICQKLLQQNCREIIQHFEKCHGIGQK
jgi:tyrosine-protein phosphatase YwqE